VSSRIRIRPKWLSNCSGAELQQLNRLRLKGESMMYEDVLGCCYAKHRARIRVFLARDATGHIVGWSCTMLPPTKKSPRYEYAIPKKTKNTPVYTYVNRAYRGLNLGKRLLLRAANFSVKRRYKPTVFFWNEKSSRFFADMQESISKLQIYDVSEWWELYE